MPDVAADPSVELALRIAHSTESRYVYLHNHLSTFVQKILTGNSIIEKSQ